eukprot:10519077-Ditylum_brightwellii.AAC.2
MAQAAITTYKREQKPTHKGIIIFLYYLMTDKKNGLIKMLPHRQIVNFDEMNRELLSYHRHPFGQAQSTPFTVAPLKELIGYMREGPLTKQLKKGTAKVNKLALVEHTTDILEE